MTEEDAAKKRIRKSNVASKQRKEDLQEALPATVTIYGKKIPVVITSLKGGLEGDFNMSTYTIRIHQGLDVDRAKSTLLHEIFHSVLELSGHNELMKEEQEEGLVKALEFAFHDVIDISKLEK